jgi:Methylase of polypeptide chain release factors
MQDPSEGLPWFHPQELSSEADRLRGNVACGGDFGTYARANASGTLEGSDVESHNLVFASQRVALYAILWKRYALASIADMGCGLGLTAGALAEQYPEAAVHAYDVSGDAIEFGRKSFPKVFFEKKAIGEETDLGRTFDLILCQEFYPFTRTNDFFFHETTIEYLRRNLSPSGVIVIVFSERDKEKSILMNIARLHGFDVSVRYLPYDRVFRKTGSFFLSVIVSKILYALTKRHRNFHIMLMPKIGT